MLQAVVQQWPDAESACLQLREENTSRLERLRQAWRSTHTLLEVMSEDVIGVFHPTVTRLEVSELHT